MFFKRILCIPSQRNGFAGGTARDSFSDVSFHYLTIPKDNEPQKFHI